MCNTVISRGPELFECEMWENKSILCCVLSIGTRKINPNENNFENVPNVQFICIRWQEKVMALFCCAITLNCMGVCVFVCCCTSMFGRTSWSFSEDNVAIFFIIILLVIPSKGYLWVKVQVRFRFRVWVLKYDYKIPLLLLYMPDTSVYQPSSGF